MISTRNRKIRAFTLLELMVAATITSVLIVVLVSLGTATLDAWGSARSFARYQSSARAALDLLDNDLRSMILRDQPSDTGAADAVWLEARFDNASGATTVELSFFARATDLEPDWDGDLAAVHYQTVDQDPARPAAVDSEGRRISLYRAVASPQVTLDEALGESDLAGVFWAGRDVADPVNFLAANVVSLSVEFWVKEPGEERRRWDRGSAGWVRVNRRIGLNWEGETSAGSELRLAGLDLAVEVVSDRGMALIRDGIPLSEVPPAERRVFSQYVPVAPEVR